MISRILTVHTLHTLRKQPNIELWRGLSTVVGPCAAAHSRSMIVSTSWLALSRRTSCSAPALGGALLLGVGGRGSRAGRRRRTRTQALGRRAGGWLRRRGAGAWRHRRHSERPRHAARRRHE